MWICGLMEPSGVFIFNGHLQALRLVFQSGHMQLWTHESLDIGLFERTIVWSWTHENFSCVHDQTIVRSKRPMSRLSCVQSYLWSDYRAFKVTYVQTIVRSKLHMSRLSCVQSYICPDYRAFKIAYVQTIVSSKLHMSRLSCVQNCICPDYRAFIFFQTM